MTTSIEDLGTILGVWAHPDDETYLSAGLMASAVAAQQRVTCVTATRGELGSMDEERWPIATLGKVREVELEASMRVLGVADHRWLDYYDGSCKDVPDEEGIGRVVALIEEVRPDSVLTFGPDGMTGHADHKAVCSWTTQAFARTAVPGAKLYYATNLPEWVDTFYDRMQKFNVFMEPGTPPVTPPEQMAIDFPLTRDVLELKLRAIECHVSQTEGMIRFFGEDFFREAFPGEYYRLGATG
jgi:LmbE family N-acetylglucosaminyl deacetylase